MHRLGAVEAQQRNYVPLYNLFLREGTLHAAVQRSNDGPVIWTNDPSQLGQCRLRGCCNNQGRKRGCSDSLSYVLGTMSVILDYRNYLPLGGAGLLGTETLPNESKTRRHGMEADEGRWKYE